MKDEELFEHLKSIYDEVVSISIKSENYLEIKRKNHYSLFPQIDAFVDMEWSHESKQYPPPEPEFLPVLFPDKGEKSMELTITVEEYKSLRRDPETLSLLEAGGVDNWDWYDESLNPDGMDYDDVMEAVDEAVDKKVSEIGERVE